MNTNLAYDTQERVFRCCITIHQGGRIRGTVARMDVSPVLPLNS